jgi:hypothetical protein
MKFYLLPFSDVIETSPIFNITKDKIFSVGLVNYYVLRIHQNRFFFNLK